MTELFWCVQCNEVFRRGEFDTAPRFVFDAQRSDFTEQPMDDWHDFLSQHESHSIRLLQCLTDSLCSTDAYRELVRTDYLTAVDGATRVLVKRSRQRIDESMHYEVVRGKLRHHPASYTFQSDLLREQLEAEDQVSPEEEVHQFLALLDPCAQRLTEQMTEEYEISLEHPMRAYAHLNQHGVQFLLSYLEKRMGSLSHWLWTFIEREAACGGVLELEVYHAFEYVPHQESSPSPIHTPSTCTPSRHPSAQSSAEQR